MSSSQTYITADPGGVFWRYEVPAKTDAKVFLLTVGRIAVVGNWYGAYNESFIAWAPMPRRDKEQEARLGLMQTPPPRRREMNQPERDLRMAGHILVEQCHGRSLAAGWWLFKDEGLTYDLKRIINEPLSSMEKRLAKALVAEKLCLTHSEVSEGMEGHRKGLKDDKLPHRSMLEVELADAVIRIADLAGAMGLDLGGAIAEKLAYNAIRPDHKPEARAAEGGKAY